MKIALLSTLTFLFVTLALISNSYAEDSPGWGLPKGAKARLGKGMITDDIAYSPDGTRLAIPSAIGIWLYDTTTYQEVALFTGHTDWVNSIAFSPDGSTLAGGGRDSIVYLWDAVTGEQNGTLTEHTSAVSSVAFSPDGNTLASGSHDDTICLWNLETSEHKMTLTGHRSSVVTVAFMVNSIITYTLLMHNQTP